MQKTCKLEIHICKSENRNFCNRWTTFSLLIFLFIILEHRFHHQLGGRKNGRVNSMVASTPSTPTKEGLVNQISLTEIMFLNAIKLGT